jgi:carbon-monoxide dehydrogenase large subunit
VQICAQKIKDKVRQTAAHIFRVSEDNVIYENGRVYVKNAPSQSRTLQEIALALWYAWDIPENMEPNLEVTTFFDPPNFNFPFGAHAAFIEIDEQTGEVRLIRYAAVDDAGTLGNRMIADGQIHGGITHGIGQALMERVVYDSEGRLLTENLADYPMPRAGDVPMFETDWTITPSPNTALGAKGLGELGAIGSTTAIANAVCDALSDLGVKHIDMPITAEKVWQTMQQARASSAPSNPV